MTKLSQITLQSLIHTQFNKARGSKRESTVCGSTGSSVYLVVSIWREQVLQLLDYRAAFDTRGPFNSFTSSPFGFICFSFEIQSICLREKCNKQHCCATPEGTCHRACRLSICHQDKSGRNHDRSAGNFTANKSVGCQVFEKNLKSL